MKRSLFPCPLVYCSIIHSCQDRKTTNVFMSGWMDKEVGYIQWSIIPPWNKGNPICDNIDEPWGHYEKWVRWEMTNTLWSPLYVKYDNSKVIVALIVIARDLRMVEMEKWLIKVFKFLVIRGIIFRDIVYKLVIMVNNTVLKRW